MKRLIKKLLREGLLGEVMYHGSKRPELDFDKRTDDIQFNMLGYGLYTTNIRKEAEYYAKGGNRLKSQENNVYIYTIGLSGANILPWKGKLPNELINVLSSDPDFFNELEGDTESGFDFMEITIDGDTYDWDKYSQVGAGEPGWAIGLNFGDFLATGLEKEEVIPTLKKILKQRGKSINDNQLPNDKYGGSIIDDDNYFYGLKNNIEINKGNIFNSLAHLSTYLYFKFKSIKTVSKFLTKHGVDGTVYGFEDEEGFTASSDYEGDDGSPTEVVVIYNPSKIKIQRKETVK